MAATLAATGKLRSRYVSRDIAAVTGQPPHAVRRCPWSDADTARRSSASPTVFSRACPDDAYAPATAKATWRKTVLHPTTLTANMFSRGDAPTTMPRRTNRAAKHSPNAAARVAGCLRRVPC
jgi:hypothetical protein